MACRDTNGARVPGAPQPGFLKMLSEMANMFWNFSKAKQSKAIGQWQEKQSQGKQSNTELQKNQKKTL